MSETEPRVNAAYAMSLSTGVEPLLKAHENYQKNRNAGDLLKTLADYHAAASLATPTDLDPTAATAISDALNKLVADAFALYLKSKSFHWHVAGPQFRDYHLLFDEQAASILKGVDELAERVRKIGKLTVHSVGEVAKLQTITDDNEAEVAPAQMIERLLADNRTMAKAQEAAIVLCEKSGDSATANLLQGFLDEKQKRVWFLFEITQAK
jgi:starvation-inducible DNA-binding protein